MCTGIGWGWGAVLVGGDTMYDYERELNPAAATRIEEAIAAFWQSQKDNKPPKPDYARDGKALAKLFRNDGTERDFRSNNYLNSLCADYVELAKIESGAKQKKDAIRAEILDYMGNSGTGYTADFNFNISTVREADISYTRKAYINLNVSERKH